MELPRFQKKDDKTNLQNDQNSVTDDQNTVQDDQSALSNDQGSLTSDSSLNLGISSDSNGNPNIDGSADSDDSLGGISGAIANLFGGIFGGGDADSSGGDALPTMSIDTSAQINTNLDIQSQSLDDSFTPAVTDVLGSASTLTITDAGANSVGDTNLSADTQAAGVNDPVTQWANDQQSYWGGVEQYINSTNNINTASDNNVTLSDVSTLNYDNSGVSLLESDTQLSPASSTPATTLSTVNVGPGDPIENGAAQNAYDQEQDPYNLIQNYNQSSGSNQGADPTAIYQRPFNLGAVTSWNQFTGIDSPQLSPSQMPRPSVPQDVDPVTNDYAPLPVMNDPTPQLLQQQANLQALNFAVGMVYISNLPAVGAGAAGEYSPDVPSAPTQVAGDTVGYSTTLNVGNTEVPDTAPETISPPFFTPYRSELGLDFETQTAQTSNGTTITVQSNTNCGCRWQHC